MPIYVGERVFAKPVTRAQFEDAGGRLVPCLQERSIGWISTHLAEDGSRSVCVLEATDAETIREAGNTAGAPYDHVWAAVRIGG
jgi:hypothetical protein